MSTEFYHPDESGLRRLCVPLIVGSLLTLVVVLGLLGYWAMKKFNPFFEYRQANREAKATLDIAQKRPLTQVEFNRTLQLLESDEVFAQITAMTVLEREAKRDPELKETVLEALLRCEATAKNPQVAKSAGISAARMKAPPEPGR